MGANIVSRERKESAAKHARRVRICACGRKVWGNGGWSSHKRACAAYAAARAALDAQRPDGGAR